MASGGAATLCILARMVTAAPVISSTVSPRTRIAISMAPICEGVASPDIMRSKACDDSSRVSGLPAATLAINPLKSSLTTVSSMDPELASMRGIPRSRKLQEILQHQVAVLGGDALGMKLHAVNGQGPV